MASLLQITQASKSYGDQVLLDNAEATFHDNVKVGFIGRNGAGKSTLLKCIPGEEELDKGDVIRSSNLKLGYLRQHDPFLPGESALDFLMRDSEQPDWKCGEVAGEFELKGSYLTGPIDKLSGGSGNLGALAGMLGSSGKAAGLENALGNVKDTNDLNTAFSALGMDSGMVGQFAPILLQYLGQQGVGGTLLKSLGSIWGV